MSSHLNISQACDWASKHLNKKVSKSNLSYLIQYGRIKNLGDNGTIIIDKDELKEYYKWSNGNKEKSWKKKLGDDLNWDLSFDKLNEKDTTKHVHRLHPYKGKFIPQLVEYFLDNHIDDFKKEVFFKKGDIVLDPFCGSGTTLIQSNELGIHSIGIDVSAFNAQISNAKIGKYDLIEIQKTAQYISKRLRSFLSIKKNIEFERKLLAELKTFNDKNFPSPEFKYKVIRKVINEKVFGAEKEAEFLPVYKNLVKEYGIVLLQSKSDNFLDKWFLQVIRDELDFVFEEIKRIKNVQTKRILSIVLSRTIRSCRATTHSDLATLLQPQIATYYCKKHGKICKPLFSILSWWERYTKDTIKRLIQFDKLRTNTFQICLIGDSRNIDLISKLEKKNTNLSSLVKNKKIDGIFSSPPYVGLIDYHEQHAYSYDLFGYKRRDELEIGPLYKGQGKEARESYVKGIAEVLKNSKKYLKKDYNIFLVANDKYRLYPKIAELAGMQIVNQYKRPVLNRVEKDRNAYAEIIFHLKEQM